MSDAKRVEDPAATSGAVCRSCKSPNGAKSLFCNQCGSKLEREQPEEVFRDSKPPPGGAEKGEDVPQLPLTGPNAPPVAERQSIPCPSCNTGLPDAAKYCSECGLRVAVPSGALRVFARQTDKDPVAVQFEHELVIGKSPECGLALDDDYVSRRHSRIRKDDGLVYLEDLASSNGTFLRVRRPIALERGDEIIVGTTVLKLAEDTTP